MAPVARDAALLGTATVLAFLNEFCSVVAHSLPGAGALYDTHGHYGARAATWKVFVDLIAVTCCAVQAVLHAPATESGTLAAAVIPVGAAFIMPTLIMPSVLHAAGPRTTARLAAGALVILCLASLESLATEANVHGIFGTEPSAMGPLILMTCALALGAHAFSVAVEQRVPAAAEPMRAGAMAKGLGIVLLACGAAFGHAHLWSLLPRKLKQTTDTVLAACLLGALALLAINAEVRERFRGARSKIA